jgi:hypothetical protein
MGDEGDLVDDKIGHEYFVWEKSRWMCIVQIFPSRCGTPPPCGGPCLFGENCGVGPPD